MAKLGTAYVEIKAGTKELVKGLDLARIKTKVALDKMRGYIRGLNFKPAIIGLTALTYGVVRLTSKWEGLFKAQEQSEAGVKQALSSMGKYNAETYQGLLNLATGLQKVTTYGDEAVLSGMKFLLTYKQISMDTLPRAAKLMTDLAALMGGDMKLAANMVGKAAMGMTGELRRAGITIDNDTFKTKGFMGVLKEMEEQVGGQAEALRRTKSGGLEAFGNTVGDLQEKLGRLSTIFKGTLAQALLPLVNKWDDWLKANEGMLDLKIEDWAKDVQTGFQNMYPAMKLVADTVSTMAQGWGKIATIPKWMDVEEQTRNTNALNREIEKYTKLLDSMAYESDASTRKVPQGDALGNIYGGGGPSKTMTKSEIRKKLNELQARILKTSGVAPPNQLGPEAVVTAQREPSMGGGAGKAFGNMGSFKAQLNTMLASNRIMMDAEFKHDQYSRNLWATATEEYEAKKKEEDEIHQRSMNRRNELEGIFYNTFTDRISGLGDLWGEFCNMMYRRFADALARMVAESAMYSGLMNTVEGALGMGGGGGGIASAAASGIGLTGGNTIVNINAIDQKSFSEYIGLNSDAVVGVVAQDMINGGVTRSTINSVGIR